MLSFENVKLHNVEYDVSMARHDESTLRATVIPILEIEVPSSRILIADLKVDNLEMIPAAKIYLKEGINKITLPPVKIFRKFVKEIPVKSYIVGYEMEVRLSSDGNEFFPYISKMNINWYPDEN